MSERILVQNATVITVDPDLSDLDRANILITDGQVTAVRAGLEVEDADRIDASGINVLPGFVDTHRHTWQTAIRQATEMPIR